jgi:CelD/BcsL family acetyltransferase involved in cellulose biosynthesis
MSTQALQWKNLPAAALASGAAEPADWERLSAERGDLPFFTVDAVNAALRCFGTGAERLLVAHRAGACVAMVLASPAGGMRWQTFQPSQMPLGVWVAQRDLELAPLALSLLRSGALPWGLGLSFTQVDGHWAPAEPDSSTNRHDPYIDSAWVDIAGTFDDYWALRGKNLRQNMRKQRNKLQTEGVEATMRVITDAAAMPEAIARYGELEARGWKAQQGTAVGSDNEQGRFYAELLGTAAARGEAFVYEYLFDGKVVASNLCLKRGRTLVILKTSYDESIQTYSPAFLLHQDLLQSLFEQGLVSRVEYYGRVMEWHMRWTDNKRALYHLTTFRYGLIKRLASGRPAEAPAATPALATEA